MKNVYILLIGLYSAMLTSAFIFNVIWLRNSIKAKEPKEAYSHYLKTVIALGFLLILLFVPLIIKLVL